VGSPALPQVLVSGLNCSLTVPHAQSERWHLSALWGCRHSCVCLGGELGRQGQETCKGEPVVVTQSRDREELGCGVLVESGEVGLRSSSEHLVEASARTGQQIIWGKFFYFFEIFWILVT